MKTQNALIEIFSLRIEFFVKYALLIFANFHQSTTGVYRTSGAIRLSDCFL